MVGVILTALPFCSVQPPPLMRELPPDASNSAGIPLGDQTLALMRVQDALDQLEAAILDSPRLFWSRTLIEEDSILEQLDFIRLNMPTALEEAEELLRQRDRILAQADRYAQEIVAMAQRKAEQLLNESTILRQAQAQAEQLLRQAYQQSEELRRQSLQESERLHQEAHHYVDQVLQDLELRLLESLRVIRNGRQNLQP
ncbi:ATP synthase F0 subunit B [Thermostichus vulcanus]|nr:ATP synthase F0 subunit B [Thermostichus vulcanus]